MWEHGFIYKLKRKVLFAGGLKFPFAWLATFSLSDISLLAFMKDEEKAVHLDHIQKKKFQLNQKIR